MRQYLKLFALVCVVFQADDAFALLHRGGSGGHVAVPQTVTNDDGGTLAFLNLAHTIVGGSTQVGWPGVLNADGYPSGSPLTNDITNQNLLFIPNYYGHYDIYWSGTGNFTISGAPYIVYSGGLPVQNIGGTATGAGQGNFYIGNNFGNTNQPTSGTPVEFAFGALISGVQTSTMTSGLVELVATTAGVFGGFSAGTIIQVNHVTNLAPGPYTINIIDNQHIELQGTTYNGSMAVVSGAIGTQSEVIFSVSGASWAFAGGGIGGAFSSMDNMVIARTSDIAAINAGHQVNPDYVSLFKAPNLNPRFIRFMALSQVIGNNSTSYTYRPTTTTLSWGLTNNVSAYWGGAATNGGSDNYTLASNPSASPSSGAFVDGEIVEGYISGANTGYNPTLAITGRTGSAPILDQNASQLTMTLGGSVPASGTTISLVFTGGGIVSGSSPFTYHYVTSTSVAGPGNKLDTSFANISININSDINGNVRGNAGPLATAGIFGQTNGVPSIQFRFNPNINSSGVAALGNGMTITGSDSASAATYTFGRLLPAQLASNQLYAFTYSVLAGGWISTAGYSNGSFTAGGGPNGGPPLEFYEDFCLQTNTGLWFNIPALYSTTAIYNTVLHIANSGVKELVLEFANETWNFGGGGTAPLQQSMGLLLGLQYPSGASIYGFVGLRITQIADQARAAWAAAGRSSSQLLITNAYQFVGPSGTQTNQFNGGNLNPASNVTLAAYGGPVSNGTTAPTGLSTNYSTFPHRPIDRSDLVSPAMYWLGGEFNQTPGFDINTGVPLASYNCALVASYNYANGNSTQQQAALDFLYNGSTGDLYNGTLNSTVNNDFQMAAWAHGSGNSAADYFGITSIVASYDTQRTGGGLAVLGVAGYEGDNQTGPIQASDATIIANDLTGLGDTSGYTSGLSSTYCGLTVASGGPTSSATSDAANMQTLLTAFKNDNRFKLIYSRYFTDFETAINSQGTRIALPATFGLEGLSAWSKYPGSIYTTPFKSWNAIQSINN